VAALALTGCGSSDASPSATTGTSEGATTTAEAKTVTTAGEDAEPASLADLSWSGDGVPGFEWGADRAETVERLTTILGPPTSEFDDVGVECGLEPRSMASWQDPYVAVAFDPDGRLGSMSFYLDEVPHASGPIGEGALLDELQALEPGVEWGGPFEGPGSEPETYYEWTLERGDTSVRGGLTGPPPDGRLESYIHLSGPYETEGCGE
jgi:hypothetical protein